MGITMAAALVNKPQVWELDEFDEMLEDPTCAPDHADRADGSDVQCRPLERHRSA